MQISLLLGSFEAREPEFRFPAPTRENKRATCICNPHAQESPGAHWLALPGSRRVQSSPGGKEGESISSEVKVERATEEDVCPLLLLSPHTLITYPKPSVLSPLM